MILVIGVLRGYGDAIWWWSDRCDPVSAVEICYVSWVYEVLDGSDSRSA